MNRHLTRFFSALFLLALALPGLADSSGRWTASRRSNDRLQLDMRSGSNRTSMPFPLSSFQELSGAAIDGNRSTPVEFRLAREAGTIFFTGDFEDGEGSGKFRFEAAPNFLSQLQAAGVSLAGKGNGDHNVLQLALFDVSTAFVKELQKLGLKDLSLHGLTALRIHGADTAYIREIQTLGFKGLSGEDLVTFRIHGVTPDYIRVMRSNGFDASGKELVSMRIHGVSPEWVQEIRAHGYRELDSEDLVTLRIHGVSSEFIKEMHQLGYTSLSAKDLVDLRIHGVTSGFVRELRDAGYENVPVRKLVEMKIHGIDAVFIRGMKGKKN